MKHIIYIILLLVSASCFGQDALPKAPPPNKPIKKILPLEEKKDTNACVCPVFFLPLHSQTRNGCKMTLREYFKSLYLKDIRQRKITDELWCPILK